MPVVQALALSLCLALPARALSLDKKYYYEEVWSPFFAPDPARPGFFHSVRPGANASSFEIPKRPGTFRVFLIGGSTMGAYWGERDLSEALRALLPGTAIEVINCGMSGYDASRERLVEKEVLRYEPDLLVFLSGHNDFFMSHAPPVPLWLLKTKDFLERWDWYRSLERRQEAAPVSRGNSLDKGDRGRRLAEFERVERDDLRTAVRRGVSVVACLPPLNYRDCPPDYEAPWSSKAFVKGWAAFLRGDAAAARGAWETGLSSGRREDADARAFLLYYLGKADEKLGRWEKASDELAQAVNAPEGYRVCGKDCLGAISRAAREEGAAAADVDAAFRAFSAPRLPGLDMFRDEFHWADRFQGLISLAIVDAMRSDPALKKKLPWDEAALAGLRRRWPADARAAAERSRTKELQAALFYAMKGLETKGSPSWLSAHWLDAVGEFRPDWIRDAASLERATAEATARANKGVWAQEQPAPARKALVQWILGEIRLRRGRFAEAEGFFTEAQRLEPPLTEAYFDLALAQGLGGARGRAKESLRRAALAGRGEEAGALAAALGLPPPELPTGKDAAARFATGARSVGSYLDEAKAAGSGPSAERALKLALGAHPDEHQLRQIAGLFFDAGDPRGAAATLETLAARKPGDAGVWAELARARARARQAKEARLALSKAESLKPDSQTRLAIALALAELGDRDACRKAAGDLLKVNPADREVQAARAACGN